jgi:hypothetical protein
LVRNFRSIPEWDLVARVDHPSNTESKRQKIGPRLTHSNQVFIAHAAGRRISGELAYHDALIPGT